MDHIAYLPSDPHLAGLTSIYMSNYLTSKTSLKTSICGDTNVIPSIIIYLGFYTQVRADETKYASHQNTISPILSGKSDIFAA